MHKNGPMAISGIEKLDRQLQEILGAYASWEEALHRAVWVVMGDSGQAPIGPSRSQALIYLRSLLSRYRISKLGKRIEKNDQLFVCVNERMTYIYALYDNLPLFEVAAYLQGDKRIGVIAWKEDDRIQVRGGGKESALAFRPNGPYQDHYRQTWRLNGDASLLDIQITGEDIEYNDYPDVLVRLYGALYSHPGRFLVITAKPGCEFVGESSPTHLNGAGHGAASQGGLFGAHDYCRNRNSSKAFPGRRHKRVGTSVNSISWKSLYY
ncbi:hypothetical protein [Aneurinibacillus tyrosinisolvens]|uniref:hypothetical protein n=1 Tax=Aneurinibacillus tyrosinisolvens TaxID=1443435 RepID=UPI001F3E2B25|nr:hypothetical protein [Aneurinibacillus tyrosinisolvens]